MKLKLMGTVFAVVALGALAAKAQPSPIDLQLARQYFDEAQIASEADRGGLWARELYGPILFIDPETRAAVANQPDREAKLESRGGVYAGKLPPEVAPANTALHWAGVDWTMVMWPLPEFRQARVRLFMHECFHRIEPGLGLRGADAAARHLDTRQGRIWLEMEWRALERAMWLEGQARRGAVADALYFRSFRRSLFPGAAAPENALEMNEGLAEYTGMKLATSSLEEFAMLEDSELREAASRHPNFVRSFAYVSGPAYGLLLDAAGSSWRTGLTSESDVGALLARAYKVELPELSGTEAIRRAQAYGGEEIVAQETRRDRDRQAKLAEARKRYIEGPVLALPVVAQFNYSFDPNHVVSVDDTSAVYEGEQVSDVWGILRAPGGFLLVRGPGGIVRVQVPAPADAKERPLKGEGWTLDMAPGWTLEAGPRPADWTLKQAGASN